MSELESNIQAQPKSLAHSLAYQAQQGTSAIEQASALIKSRNKIVIVGMGASLFASIPLQYYLSSLGMDAVAIEAGELLHYLHGAWKDAAVLMVSRSGESVEVARLLEKMKGNVPIIGVTNEPQSLLSRSADVTLQMSSLADQYVAIQSYIATVLTLHLLGAAVEGSFSAAQEGADRLVPAFTALVQHCASRIEAWDDFLKPHSTPYLLARGASLASAYEGALLFHEVAKCPAVPMPIASFRHGPVEVVDSVFRGFVFVPHDHARELNMALARDLVRFGGEIRLIGPSLNSEDRQVGFEIPAVPQTLAPMFEIVPLQFAALRLAILRGVDPGSFRYAPQVAVNEASFGKSEVAK